MSSTRAPRVTPHHIVKPAIITLEEWEGKAPLDEFEASSIHSVKSAGRDRARLPHRTQVR
jgi:hypothetical protein